MQFSAVEIRFIVTSYLNSTFTNDLKRKYFFRKMFIVTDYAALTEVEWLCRGGGGYIFQRGGGPTFFSGSPIAYPRNPCNL